MSCDLACALINQSVLYIAILGAPFAVIILITRIFTEMGFKGFGILLPFCLCLIGLSFWGLIPWYITILTTIISIYVLWNNRGRVNIAPSGSH